MSCLQRTALLGCLSLGLVLAGCGGGGSDAGISGSTQFAVQDAYRKLINATTGWSVTGTGSDAATYRIDFNLKLAAPAVFPVTGANGAVSEQFTRVVRNGSMLAEGTSRLFFNAGTLALLGTDEGDGTCSLATSNSTLPASAGSSAQCIEIASDGTLGSRA